MASDAEVAYWRERALFYERRLLALGESVDYPTPESSVMREAAVRYAKSLGVQLTVDDCIAEVEHS